MLRFFKSSQLPLFWKFTIAITSMVLFFGSLNLLFIRNRVYKTFENQIEKLGISIAIGIAETAIDPLLFNDIAALNKLLIQAKSTNPDVEYIFLLSNTNEIIAHTFSNYLPREIINANNLPDSVLKSTVLIHDIFQRKRTIRDIATPIFDKRLGTVRVGLNEDAFSEEISKTTRLFLFMVFALLALGVALALIISFIISSPVKAISDRASRVNFDLLSTEDGITNPITNSYANRIKNLFNLTDEIDVLNSTFIQMLNRLRLAYAELKKTQESLSQTEKLASVGTLAAGLAHEINNPIAGVRSCLRRIAEKPENIKQNQEYIEMMKEAIGKIEVVVEGLLNFSRKQELTFVEMDVIKHIENSLALANFQLESSKITIEKSFEQTKILISGSPNHLEQVFVNIILNSIDAINEKRLSTPNHWGLIRINVKQNSTEVCISFTDNGIGMPDDKVASLFDPFFTLKKIRQGTGLGMAVSFNIIQNHLGQIAGKNAPKGGFIIIITLPKQH